ncbi:hypothetical protein [Micromonospora sp. ATCC 39149]|uniref:effector-associated domain 2-containing protein n=1 Tax=Micromonospora sp. (strain ATCC 39149 / NRRL 15099 / SCC 1413) TaxID=219305 RepID=UPI00055E7FAD|nr:hypothetical protein [Micromonospora sp. ATCC 39149]
MSEADQEPADALSAIVEALLAVDEINDAAARRAMVMTMPTEIRSRVIDAPSARGHTLNWVRACTKFLHGREALRSALTTHVAETALDVAAALDAIDRWWPTLVAPAKDDADPPHAGIGEWDPMALGVHRVSVPEEPGHGGPLPALTPYVRRRHDTQLTQILPPSSSTLVVLHGGPATGKTRAALEAVREVLPDWPVLRPLSTAELLDAVRRPAPQRGTVIWLDDAGDLLDAAEEVPLEMRRLLGRSGPAPVVVVATLRSDRLRQLADPGQAGTRQLQLLLKAAVHVSVPEHFTGAQRQEWRAYGPPRSAPGVRRESNRPRREAGADAHGGTDAPRPVRRPGRSRRLADAGRDRLRRRGAAAGPQRAARRGAEGAKKRMPTSPPPGIPTRRRRASPRR